MGIQMIVISLSALALVGLVNREGVDTTAAFGVAMQLWTYVQMPAMALGAAVSAMAAQNIGAGKWDRVGADHPRRASSSTLLITGALIVAADARRPAVLACSWAATARRCRSPGTSTLLATWNFLLFGVTMVLFGTVRANGAVWAPLIILAHRPGAGALRLHLRDLSAGSAPTRSGPASRSARSSTSRWPSAYYLHGGWRKARMTRRAPPDDDECTEEAQATREPGGALNPAG